MTNHYNQNLKIEESIPILPPGELASNILHVFCALISEKTFSCTEQTSMKVYCFGAWFSVILFILYKCFPSISHNNSPCFPGVCPVSLLVPLCYHLLPILKFWDILCWTRECTFKWSKDELVVKFPEKVARFRNSWKYYKIMEKLIFRIHVDRSSCVEEELISRWFNHPSFTYPKSKVETPEWCVKYSQR